MTDTGSPAASVHTRPSSPWTHALAWSAAFALGTALVQSRAGLLARSGRLGEWAGLTLLDLLIRLAWVALLLGWLWAIRTVLWRLATGFSLGLERLDTVLFGRLSPRYRARAAGVAIGLAIGCLAALLATRTVVFSRLEAQVPDLWYTYLLFPIASEATGSVVDGHAQVISGRERIRDDIAIVKIDNPTLYRLGWPLPRKLHAELIDALTAGRPRSIFFDVMFLEESADHPEWDRALGEAAARAGNVYFAYPIESGAGRREVSEETRRLATAESFPATRIAGGYPDVSDAVGGEAKPDLVIPDIARAARGLACINILPDEDSVVRRGALAFRQGARVFPAPALRLAMDTLGVAFAELRIEAGRLVLGDALRVPLDRSGMVEVRFLDRSDPDSNRPFPSFSYFQVIRKDWSFRLANNAIDPELELEVGPDTALFVDGKPRPLRDLDLGLVTAGRWVRGRLGVSPSGIALTELDLRTSRDPEGPAYEPDGDQDLRFRDALAAVRLHRLDASQFADKHILVGSTATGAYDMRVTPVGSMPGVEYHATLLNGLLNRDFIAPAPAWANVLLVVALTLTVGFLTAVLRPLHSLLAAGSLAVLLASGVFLAFRAGHRVELIPALVALATSFVLVMAYNYRLERREKLHLEARSGFIRQTFGRYLSDAVVASLLESPEGLKLGGDRREVTIMMTDLRGFTSMSARLEPEGVVSILNNYLGIMTDIVVKHRGTIDEFIGDAILVVFGAPVQSPDDALRAVACAIEMELAMDRVNAWNREHDLPEVAMGIGINTGEVVVGNIGSEKRAKYGIVGTPINMCSRIEGYTVGGQVFISRSTRDAAGPALRIDGEMTVSPKGIQAPITIYQVGGVGPPFDVFLPEQNEDLVPLLRPLLVEYNVLEGKHAGTELERAEVVTLSEQGCELRLGRDLDALTNLKLTVLGDDGARLPGEFYAKVLRRPSRGALTYLRFTSVPPELKNALRELLAARRDSASLIQESSDSHAAMLNGDMLKGPGQG